MFPPKKSPQIQAADFSCHNSHRKKNISIQPIVMKYCIIIYLLLLHISLLAQEKPYPQDPKDRVQYIKEQFGGVPLIICNEEEITLEEFAKLELKYFGTCQFLKVRPILDMCVGDRGENGLIYVHAEKERFRLPYEGGYFKGGDFPAEFAEGEDSLFRFLKAHQTVPKEVLKSDIDGTVAMTCFFDEKGNLEKSYVNCIRLDTPQEIDIWFSKGEIMQSWLLNKKALRLMEKIAHSAMEVTKQLPPFKPARVFLREVKYIMDVDIPIRYDAIQDEN